MLDYKFYTFEEASGRGNVTTENDPPPRSKYAFVHVFCADDLPHHKMVNAQVIGYQLKKYNSSIDRVMILPIGIRISDHEIKMLKSVYTHIIYRPFINWPCKGPEKHTVDKQFYFMLNIWTLNYSKLLHIGGYTIFRKNPSKIFEFKPPAAAPEFQTWIIADLGPTQNTDFMLIEPSMEVFEKIVNFGCTYTSVRVNLTKSLNTAYGPYDTGLVIRYFKGNITTLQWWWNYEYPGHYIFCTHKINRYMDPQVVSIRIPETNTPWTDKTNTISLLWINEASEFYTSVGEKLPTSSLDVLSAKKIETPAPKYKKISIINRLFKDSPNVQPSRYYPEFYEICDQQFLFQCLIIVLASIGFVAYAITVPNIRQPWPVFEL